MPTEVERTFVPTAIPTAGFGIDIALECRVGDSQPPPDIVWFQDGTPLIENLENNLIRFLEGGRWAYIRDIETFPRDYHCEVSNVRMHESVRSPETYFVNGTGLVNGMDFVYKEIGDLTAFSAEREDEDFEFSYVASQGTLNRVCAFSNSVGTNTDSNQAVGTVTNLPPPPAVVTLECREGQATIISSGAVTVQRELSHPHPHPHPPHTYAHAHTHTHTYTHMHTGKAVITMDPSEVNIREVIVGQGPATTFSCANTGYPATSTVWYFNGDVIDSSFVGIVFDATMLTIANPQVSHSGVYQCFVSNTVSEDNAAWLLEVRAPGNIYHYLRLLVMYMSVYICCVHVHALFC